MKGNMSQSRNAEELKNYVPKTRKINGQTLDNDVDIKNVESADKLKTARTINGVAFDGTNDIKVYSECELPKQRVLCNKKRWVRFAEVSSMSFSAIIQISREYAYGIPEVYTLCATSIYSDFRFVQISSLSKPWGRYITKVRAVYFQNTVYLEYYYDSTEPNNIVTKVSNILTSHLNDPFVNIIDEDGEIPEGYSVEEFDLSESPIKASSLQIGNTTITETQLQALLALLT